jgi:hypothetical protein
MAAKLTTGQQASLAVLETFRAKFDQIHRIIEEMGTMRADETQVRRLARTLDEMKAAAGSIGEGAVADSCGVMATLARRTGGHQMVVRGLREGLMGLKTNFEGAYRKASTPGEEAESSG